MDKKKLVTAVVAATLSVACVGGALAGCANANDRYLFEYDISVVGGTGGGTKKDGESCTVTAQIPEGKVFDKWVNEYGEVLSTVNPYTFKVDGDLEIHAVVADAETFRVEVVGGTITGTSDYVANVYKGQSVSVTAQSSQSHKFVKWIINGTDESTANPYVFTADKDIRLEAVVDESYLVAVSGGTIGDGEEKRKIFAGGDECTIVAEAPPQGSSFIYWYVIDENESEVRVSYSERYTFTVTGTDKYYAKYGKKYTLSVTGGTVDGLSEVSLVEGDNATVTLDTAQIPTGQGFVGWKIGDITVSNEFTYVLRNISENTVIEAVYANQIKFATPGNSNNEMFKFNSSYTVEFDRNGDKSHTEFTDKVEYIMYYFYESPYADKDDYVGRLKLVRGSDRKDQHNNGCNAEFVTLDGEYVSYVKGGFGDLYLDENSIGNSKKDTLFGILKAAMGDGYDADTPYYVAAQTCGGNPYSVYAPSEISAIGPMVFVEGTAPARHTVTVSGGRFKNVEQTSITMYAGQKVTVLCDSDLFNGWVINGDTQNPVDQNPYTFTVDGDTTIEAVYEGQSTVTVHGGTIKGSGATSGNYDAGERVTVVADPAESGKVFAYWYTLDGDAERKLADTEEYSFDVNMSIELYAKYADTHTLKIVGGTLDGADKTDNNEYTVTEANSYTVKLDPSLIPKNQGFIGWKIGDDVVSAEYEYTFAAGDITADTTIEAEYAALVYEFTAAPKMDDNESFRPRWQNNNKNDYALEMARGGKLFYNSHVDYIKLYIYTSPYADKDAYIGAFKFDNAGGYRIATMDGKTLWGVEGNDGNFWLETKDGYSNPSTKANCRSIFEKILGDAFDENTPYYIAAQTCGKDYSIYAPSDISVIGPREFIFGNVAKHTVTVKGGVIKNSTLTSASMYEGQEITVTCTSDSFKQWLVNGEIASTDSDYTFTVSADVTVVAVLDGEFTISVQGGTIGGEPSATVESGALVTVIADAAEAGKAFAYWYKLDGGVKTKLSDKAEYAFNADADLVIIAEFVNIHTLTISGGTLDGADKTDNGEYTVTEIDEYTVRLDLSAIPSGQGFTGWMIGDSVVSTEYEYTFAAGSITADTTIEAVYAAQVHEFTKPVNENNEMFKFTNTGTMEIDRKNKGVQSEFDNANIEYMMFYFYTKPFVNNTVENSVGSIKLVRDKSSGSEKFYFAKLDGTKIWDVKGRKSDLYQDETCGQPSKKDAMFLLVKAGVASYDPNTPYYIAVQSFGKAGSIYAPSEISAIGPQALIYNNVAQYTVTVDGGVVENTSLSSVTLYSGQTVTIVPSKDMFEHWLVNDEQITDNPYTFTVTADISLKAIYSGESSVTITGGVVFGSSDTHVSVSNGSEITVTANEPAENTEFAYWYKLDGDKEVILSRNETYTFTVLEDMQVFAKFAHFYSVTVTGGKIDGLTAVDGAYTVSDCKEYVLRLGVKDIPQGKSFKHWAMGDGEVISTNYVHMLTAGSVTGDTEITAVYADTTALDVALSMASGTEMIRHNDDYVIDIDRCFPSPKNTAFQENVDHVKLYIYTSADADIDDYVGILIVDRKCESNNANNQPLRFATADGVTITRLEGVPNNIWLSTLDGYSNDRRGNFRKFLQQCIGDGYSAEQSYYFAAQACGDHETYGDGAISAIGTQAF